MNRFYFPLSVKQVSGFTLLEMVLVLLIMGMTASLSMVFIDNEDNQLRYQETIQKLQTMNNATITVKEYGSDFLFSGFAFDNGVLPNEAKAYIQMPDGWTARTLFNLSNKPKYRITKTQAYNDIDIAGINLYNGYRTGYISTGIDSAGEYKTGWGHTFTVAENTATHALNLTYDESLNPPDYSMAVNKDVPADSWSIPLSEVNINLHNTGTTPINKTLIVALTVFKNIKPDLTDTDITNDSVWQTYHYTHYCSGGGTKTLIAGNDGSTTYSIVAGDTFTEKGLWQTEAILTAAETSQTACPHTANIDNTLAMATRIPAGEHIVFSWVDENSNNILDSTELIQAQAVLKVIPRYTQPTITLDF